MNFTPAFQIRFAVPLQFVGSVTPMEKLGCRKKKTSSTLRHKPLNPPATEDTLSYVIIPIGHQP
jgi:hypothetical protein